MACCGTGPVIGLLSRSALPRRGLLHAQTTFATLRGTIQDPSGAVIANAAVAVKNIATGASRSTMSNGAGIYSFPDLPPSTYELTVSAVGFANQRRTNIGLTVGAEEVLNITLSPSDRQLQRSM